MLEICRIISKLNAMSKLDFEAMSLDELWTLHEQLGRILSERIVVEKRELEHRLVQLNRGKNPDTSVGESKPSDGDRARQRRKYPRVLPKYQNPSMPTETWSGRGKQPRWLVLALKAGSKIEDFKIAATSTEKAQARR
jgi:DNA-binding protein H-NS